MEFLNDTALFVEVVKAGSFRSASVARHCVISLTGSKRKF